MRIGAWIREGVRRAFVSGQGARIEAAVLCRGRVPLPTDVRLGDRGSPSDLQLGWLKRKVDDLDGDGRLADARGRGAFVVIA